MHITVPPFLPSFTYVFPKLYRAKSKPDSSATPIPKASYHTLKEKRIREMLSEHDLPATGDKDTLTRRHERWVLLYNANLDRNPQDRLTYDEMKKDLKKWEETRSGKKKVGVTDVEAYQVRVLPLRSGSEQKC